MRTYSKLWSRLCSFENLHRAYRKARRGKHNKTDVQEFSKHWLYHLHTLRKELETKMYRPQPLKRFVLRDPKTRVISVSDFRDRVVHHALVNILRQIFEPRFILDSYASQKGKGTLAALKRFDAFKRKASKNHSRMCYVLKADVKHYFDTVDHATLVHIIKQKVRDKNVLWLTALILKNHHNPEKGMPLGNWTSQFFANVYLNELDQYVKHELGVKYYIRYVDDFVILHHKETPLESLNEGIDRFLRKHLKLSLHPTKCRIIPLHRGVPFLGFRIFKHHKIPRRKNLRKIKRKLAELVQLYKQRKNNPYDIFESLNGWNGYATHGNTYRVRTALLEKLTNQLEIS